MLVLQTDAAFPLASKTRKHEEGVDSKIKTIPHDSRHRLSVTLLMFQLLPAVVWLRIQSRSKELTTGARVGGVSP